MNKIETQGTKKMNNLYPGYDDIDDQRQDNQIMTQPTIKKIRMNNIFKG